MRKTAVIIATKTLQVLSEEEHDKKPEGLLVITYNPEVFRGEASDDKNGYSMILDARKRIVFHPEKQYVGQTLSSNIRDRMTGEKGTLEVNINGKRTLMIYSGTRNGGWTVAKLIPLEKIYSRSLVTTVIFAVLLVLLMTAITLMGMSVSRQVVLPIRRVTDTFRSRCWRRWTTGRRAS